jgi:hypothetical protein
MIGMSVVEAKADLAASKHYFRFDPQQTLSRSPLDQLDTR